MPHAMTGTILLGSSSDEAADSMTFYRGGGGRQVCEPPSCTPVMVSGV